MWVWSRERYTSRWGLSTSPLHQIQSAGVNSFTEMRFQVEFKNKIRLSCDEIMSEKQWVMPIYLGMVRPGLSYTCKSSQVEHSVSRAGLFYFSLSSQMRFVK